MSAALDYSLEDLETLFLYQEAERRGLIPLEDKKEEFKDSLFEFSHFLGYSDMTERTHGPMAEILEGSEERKLIVVPRGCFKSSLCSVAYPLYRLILNPNLRILIDSEVYTNSVKFLYEIKGHLSTSKFIERFGDWKNKNRWREGEIEILPRTKNLKEASITCSGVGAQKTGQHYDLIISDDLSSPKNTTTPEVRQKVISHFRLYSSLLDPGGEIVVVGTRYHEEDIIGYIINMINPKEERGLL